MSRFGSVALILLASCLAGPGWAVAQNSDESGAAAPAKTPDLFFAGSVVKSTTTTLVVSRTVVGKKETHSFVVTSETKVEGRLRTGVRVTVGYAQGDRGDSALLIVVRSSGAPAKNK